MRFREPLRFIFPKSNKGFTLVETMMSVGVMSIVMAGIATAVVSTVKEGEMQAKDSMIAMEDLMVQTAQQDYLTRAAPSYYFLHVPIRSFCGSSEKVPCLRQLDSVTGALAEVNSAPGIPNSIDFYKDVSGELKKVKLSSMSAAGAVNEEVHMMAGTNIDVSRLTAQRKTSFVYASWPLTDEYSEALPILVRKKDAAMLSHLKQFGASWEKAAPGGVALYNVSLNSAKAQALAKSLKDSLVVVYNINRPSQFVVQKVTDILNCPQDAGTKNLCKQAAMLISDFATPTLETAGFANVMAVKTNNVPISSGFTANANIGSRAHLTSKYIPTSKSVLVQGNWFAGTNTATDYLFPRNSFSLYDDRAILQGDLSYSPVDIKRIQHYMNANGNEATLVMLPVDLGYIKLKESRQFKDKFDLVVESASHEVIVLVPSIKYKTDADTG